ncbi:MAG: hypothetical protein B6D45_10560 [Ignavibacteriales bacterium UTCHB3]|nr:MAG: hypothetical protein B6D45_10560 [Ignavibacteriales bacterium UTCHB3]
MRDVQIFFFLLVVKFSLKNREIFAEITADSALNLIFGAYYLLISQAARYFRRHFSYKSTIKDKRPRQ